MSQSQIQLGDNDYCWVLNKLTGKVENVEGPQLFALDSHEEVVSRDDGSQIQKKLTIAADQWLVIVNPYNPESGTYEMGSRKILKGPLMYSMKRYESVVSKSSTYVLQKSQSMSLQATHDHEDTVEENGKMIVVQRKAGEKWLLKGEATVIPTIHQKVVMKPSPAISIQQNEGVYILNLSTQEVRLVEGPKSIFLDVHEELWKKDLSAVEYDTLFANERAMHHLAHYDNYLVTKAIKLTSDEAMCVLDYSNDTEKYLVGPQNYLLRPHEHIKSVTLSGNTPKEEMILQVAKVKIGPAFSTDMVNVRTHDNVELQITLQYKWGFTIPKKLFASRCITAKMSNEDKKYYSKHAIVDPFGMMTRMFSGDFIGYMCQSMRSRIRSLASQVPYEQFVKDTANLIKDGAQDSGVKGVFRYYDRLKKTGREYEEYSFFIEETDVKSVVASEPEIRDLLREAQNTNQVIALRKMKESESIKIEMANLDSEIDAAKRQLDFVKAKNKTYASTEEAKLELETLKLAQNTELELAKRELEKQALNDDLESQKRLVSLFKSPAAGQYLEMLKAQNLDSVESITVIPSGLTKFGM
jgi:hypothetical protein